MKNFYFALCAAALLVGCNQAAPDTSAPTVSAPAPAAVPAAPAPVDSAAKAVGGAPAPAPAAAPPVLREAETLKLAFAFRPIADPDNPGQPRTNARLLLQGAKPQDIDLGKFGGQPDVVDAAKAKLANFPAGMVMGFRSYQASSGTSQDLAVLHVDGRYLRIVQRRVEETAAEPGVFETAREIPLPANTRVVAAPGVTKK
ncbi:hypothetical protein [Hymenobacter sp.]|uniref:hypothetical protein n=1 Tax=Hymenobacter sp. TaxID=1898978 RepID=UPI00286B8A7B|nr:hypothetical protein [Hymenobacter sp.]